MAHNLFLGMYSFKIKKRNTRNHQSVSNNDFLSEAYPTLNNKFSEGFVQDIVKIFDTGTFKNDKNTHGAILENKEFNAHNRTFDILINGGITGLKQYIIDESGNKSDISDKETIGLKFYARFWMPSNSNAAYVFIQKYGTLSIKPIFDSILKKVLKEYDYVIAGRKIKATTTKKRQREFLKHSSLKDVILISKKSIFDTNSVQAQQVTVKMSRIKNSSNNVDEEDVKAVLNNHGFTIGKRNYELRATYLNDTEGYRQERTVQIDDSDETVNIIPSVIIPKDCIDKENSPIFNNIKKFVDIEMDQVKKEAKL